MFSISKYGLLNASRRLISESFMALSCWNQVNSSMDSFTFQEKKSAVVVLSEVQLHIHVVTVTPLHRVDTEQPCAADGLHVHIKCSGHSTLAAQ